MGCYALRPLQCTIHVQASSSVTFFVTKISLSSQRTLMSPKDTSIWCMNCYNETSCLPVSTNPRSSSLQFLFCGYAIVKNGVHRDTEKIKVVRGWPAPTTVHALRQFIGLCAFYKHFVEGFQAVAAPLPGKLKADLHQSAQPCIKLPSTS